MNLGRVVWRVKRKANSIIDWIAIRSYNRGNVVHTHLPPGHYERGDLLLHSSFTLLQEFVEKDMGPRFLTERVRNLTQYTQSEECLNEELPRLNEEIQNWYEVLRLYRWWVYTRPTRKDYCYEYSEYLEELRSKYGHLHDYVLDGKFCRIVHHYSDDEAKKLHELRIRSGELTLQYETEDSEMLESLVKIRKFLRMSS